jgi:hypothetical protein
MTCRQWSDEFKRWLGREWGDEGAPKCPSSLKRHAESCPRCGPRLQAALLLVEGKALQLPPPPGLASRISARLSGAAVVRAGTWPLRAGIAAAALLAVALVLGLVLGMPGRAGGQTIVVRFELEAPEAREVSVVGSWNRWNPDAQKLTDADRDGVWEIEIQLKRGQEHQYQFLINGETWIPDPETPLQVDDGFGGVNSVLQI